MRLKLDEIKKSGLLGPYSVVFPVGIKEKDEKNGIIIGKGSRVLGSVISGAEVPMGETYPVLIQLDHAFVMANNKKIDLQGCVLIAKSETVIATGKVKMEPESVTCYGPSGHLYSKSKVMGWFSDPKDDNFGMRAELRTNAAKKSLSVFSQSFTKGIGAAMKEEPGQWAVQELIQSRICLSRIVRKKLEQKWESFSLIIWMV